MGLTPTGSLTEILDGEASSSGLELFPTLEITNSSDIDLVIPKAKKLARLDTLTSLPVLAQPSDVLSLDALTKLQQRVQDATAPTLSPSKDTSPLGFGWINLSRWISSFLVLLVSFFLGIFLMEVLNADDSSSHSLSTTTNVKLQWVRNPALLLAVLLSGSFWLLFEGQSTTPTSRWFSTRKIFSRWHVWWIILSSVSFWGEGGGRPPDSSGPLQRVLQVARLSDVVPPAFKDLTLNPELRELLTRHGLKHFWSSEELQYLNTLSWYDFFQHDPASFTARNVMEGGTLLLRFRNLGDPVDFTTIPPGVMNEPLIQASMEINTGDVRPIKSTPYPTSPKKRILIESEMEKMLAKKIIRTCNSAWASPVVLVPKPDGSWRFCVSYVKLNQVTKKDSYPLHRPDAVAQLMQSMKIFTTCDLQSGFWQCRLQPSAQQKCAFVTHMGTHTFNVMPFGLANAPSTFQRMMDRVLDGLLYKNCFIFIDDICVFSKNFDEHLVHLQQVFNRLEVNGLKIKLSKCHFFQSKVEFLGMEFSSTGCRPKTSNVEGILAYADPRSVKDIRSFLGMVGFYRSFISHFSEIALPLTRLLKKDSTFAFHTEQKHAFEQLKGALVSRPILHHPDFSLPFIIQVDTSGFAIGAVLAQEFPSSYLPTFERRELDFPLPFLEKGTRDYEITDVFMPGFVLPFQVHGNLFGSVDHYVTYVKAESHGLDELVTALLSLDYNLPDFKVSLSDLMTRLDASLLRCPRFVPEGWALLADVAYYEGTVAKFYQQPSATSRLLLMAPNLRCQEANLFPVSYPKVLRAVHSKLSYIAETGTLDPRRPLFSRHPVGFWSSTLSLAEQGYDARERECLGIIRACEHYDATISMCQQLLIECDHKPLAYLANCDHQARLYRWNLRLQRYAPFTVVHLPGWLNGPPDGLSRYLTSRFTCKQLSETLYGSEEELFAPPPEHVAVLKPFIPKDWVIYDPISVTPSLPNLWLTWGYEVLPSDSSNFFAKNQRPASSSYNVVVSTGPFADLGTTVDILLEENVPWALFVPTRALTQPRYRLQSVSGLKVIALSSHIVFRKRSNRSLPLHRVWVTFGLSSIPKDFQIVSLDDQYAASNIRPPPDIQVALPLPVDRLFVGAVTRGYLRRNEFPPQESPVEGSSPSSAIDRGDLADSPDSVPQPQPVPKKMRKSRHPKRILYEVLDTIDHRVGPLGTKEFLIQWKPSAEGVEFENSWQPESGLSSTTLDVYWSKLLRQAELAAGIPQLPVNPLPVTEFRVPPGVDVDAHRRPVLLETLDREVPELPKTFPRVHHDQFKFAQLRDPELAAYLELVRRGAVASDTLSVPPTLVLPTVYRYKAKYLLLQRVEEGKTVWDLPDSACLREASIRATRLLGDSSTHTFEEDRFVVKHGAVGGMTFHYRELSVTRKDLEDFSTHLKTPFAWLPPKASLLRNLSRPAFLLFTALRDNMVAAPKKVFPSNMVVKDGVLYVEDPVTRVAKVVVPQSLRLKLMYIAHDLPSSAHRGPSATYKQLNLNYWWKGMKAEVHRYCLGCLKCCKGKAVGRDRYGYMQRYALVPPGHTLHLDFYGPFTPTPRGNTIVLTVIDRCTGYLWAFAAKDSTAETLANLLYDEWMMEYFLPVLLISDNGPSFISDIYKVLCRLFYVTPLYVTPYNPSANGKVERVHKDLKPALKASVAASGTDWDLKLKPIVLAKRTTLLDDSVYTPFQLWHGRPPVTVLDLLSGRWDVKLEKFSFLRAQLESQDAAMRIIAAITLKREARFKLVRDTKARVSPTWEPGQLVLIQKDVKIKGVSQKLTYQWVGPVCITRRFSPVIYEVNVGAHRHDTSGGALRKYHVRRLYPFFPSSHPVTSKLLHIDLFDADSDLSNLPAEDELQVFPTLDIAPLSYVLALVDGVLRVGRVMENDLRDQTVDLHLFDTAGMGTAMDDPLRWTKSWLPLYLNQNNGLVAVPGAAPSAFTPLIQVVSHFDILKVPFLLSKNNCLKAPQQSLARDWYSHQSESPSWV